MPRKRKPYIPPVGRPIKKIDWDEVDKCLEAGCTGTQVAGYLGMHADTLYERCFMEKGMLFSAYFQQKSGKGESLILKKQLEKALIEKGDTQMLIHLGKTRLKQRDTEKEEDKNSAINPHLETLHSVLSENLDLKASLKKIQEEINAIKSQANPVIPGSDAQVQYLGGGSEVGEDLLESAQTDTLA